MRKILKLLFVNSIVLYLAISLYPGLVYDSSLQTLFWASLAVLVLDKTVKPMIKLLILPINVLTLGLFGWVAHVITMFLLTELVAGVAVVPFYFEGFTYQGFIVPGMKITLLLSYILASVIISLAKGAVLWLISE